MKMNRCEKNIALRIHKGDLPAGYSPYDDADREICGTITTTAFDYTKRGQIVIFEYEETNERISGSHRLLAGEKMEAGTCGVLKWGGLSTTLTAEMGQHGNNFVYVLGGNDEVQESVRNSER